jgi:hypothetical protein
MHVFIADVGPTFGRFHSPTASSQRGDVGIHSDRWNDLRRRTLFLVGMAPGEQSNPDLTNAGSLQKPMSRTFIDPDGGRAIVAASCPQPVDALAVGVGIGISIGKMSNEED